MLKLGSACLLAALVSALATAAATPNNYERRKPARRSKICCGATNARSTRLATVGPEIDEVVKVDGRWLVDKHTVSP
jgi:hypothetical protein